MTVAIDAGPLAALGWDGTWADSFRPHVALARTPARVVAVHKETSIVRDGSGDRPAVVSGRFRFDAVGPSDFPAVGDWVALEAADATSSTAVIAAILPRRSSVRRSAGDASRRGGGRLADEQVIVANVDIALLVAGLDGDLNLRRLERYLAVAWSSGAAPVIVLNKVDVAEDVERRLVAVEAVAPGVPIVAISARTGQALEELGPHLVPGGTAVVLGSSGVGKSTLLNTLLGEERQATAAVREDDARGRHTTRHRELFRLPGGALLIDTPGLRALEVVGAEEGVGQAFDDVAEIAARCRFSDCRHEAEPGCAVRAAIENGTLNPERFAAWQKLDREAAHEARRADPLAASENRRKWKAIHRAVNRHMQQKYGEDAW